MPWHSCVWGWGNLVCLPTCATKPFAQTEQQREAQALIDEEKLNADAAKRYITNSLKREFASDNGTQLNAVLPKMSPLNPQYLTKKQTVFEKIAAFVEKFKGVGGGL